MAAATIAAVPRPVQQVSLKGWIAVLGTMLGAFMAILDIQITNSSLNDILGTLNATLQEGSWITTAYLIAEIIIIPLTGWLAGVFSTRRVLMISTVGFIVCSVGCGLAWDLPSMIAFRALQGLSGGFLIPMAFATMLMTLPPEKMPMGNALFGITATFAPTIGPTLGGWLTNEYGWPFIFYLNILPGLVMLAAIWYSIPGRPVAWEKLRQGDWWGIGAMAVGLATLEYVLEEGNRDDWFNSPLILTLSLVSVTALGVFFWRVLRAPQPFINLRLLGRRNFGWACVINLALGLGVFGSIFLLPVYLAMIQHYSAMQIGLVIMWQGLPSLLVMPLIPQLMKRFDARILLTVGISLFAASCLWNTHMSHDTAIEQLRLPQILRAIGQPLIFVSISLLATAGIEKAQVGSASGLFNMIRNLGGSIGIAILSTILTRQEQLHSQRLGEAISLYDPAVQERLGQLTQAMTAAGTDLVTAQNRATAVLDLMVRREAFVQAFNDCFLFVAAAMLLSLVAVVFLQKAQGTAEAAH